MNPRFFLRRHPQENKENVEKSENSEPKNETFQEKLTFGILKTFARNGAVTGLQPDEKRGQRKSVPRVWWSWGELNPRPQVFFVQFYMCSRLIWVSSPAPRSDTLRKKPASLNLI